MDPDTQRRVVATYYGKTLQSNKDLKTSACCPTDSVPKSHRAYLAKLHPDVTSKFYGCGSPIPSSLSGTTLIDLGCGTGRDAYLASALVGTSGKIIGIDMSPGQLSVASAHRQFHAEAFFGPGASSNVEFRSGYIEDLRSASVEDAVADVVISNCVCNLSPDKHAVFAEVARVLVEGGEFYFSDVYADRRLSEEARCNEVLVSECLGGALYIDDFRRTMADVGFHDIRVVSVSPVALQDPTLLTLVPDVTFYSLTIRAFKVPGLEDRREDYGQVATYTSSCGDGLRLDIDFNFEKGVAVPVDANTAAILQASRFKSEFSITPKGGHRGQFRSRWANTSGDSVIACFRPASSVPSSENILSGNPKCSPAKDSKPACCAPDPSIRRDANLRDSKGDPSSNRKTMSPNASASGVSKGKCS